MPLIITGNPKDVEKYKKLRNVTQGVDPSTGQAVKYGGLKKFGDGNGNAISVGNNPWVKYGPEYRIAQGFIKSMPKAEGKSVAFDPEMRLEIRGIANANIIDRADERVNPVGLQAEHYMKNPVLLLDHMYRSNQTVGKVTKLEPESDGVKFEAFVGDPASLGGSQFLTEAQKEARSLVAQGILQTVSIGFIPKKIRAPMWDDNGNMVEPAIIEQWEMLELSIVAVPANPGAIFEAKCQANSFYQLDGVKSASLTSTTKSLNNINSTKSDPLIAQTLLFERKHFSLEQAKEWADKKSFKTNRVKETDDTIEFVQRDTKDFIENTFKEVELDTGVKEILGRLTEDGEKAMEELLKKIDENLTKMNTTISEGFKGLNEQNEKILGSLADGKTVDPAPTDPEPTDGEKSLKEAVEKNANSIKEINDNIGKIVAVVEKIAPAS